MPCGVERFERVRRDRHYIDLEKSPAAYWGNDLLQGALAVFCIVAVVGFLYVVM